MLSPGVSRMTGRMGRWQVALWSAEWISGAYRHGSQGRILGRQHLRVGGPLYPSNQHPLSPRFQQYQPIADKQLTMAARFSENGPSLAHC